MTFEVCFLTFSVYIGSAIYSAGIPGVMHEFGVSQVAATLGLTLFVAGYGLGPMIWSPLSEIPQIGRNPIYILTLALFVVLQVPTALATNFGMLLAFRFITGFVGSPSLATGGASIGDMYTPAKRTYGLAVWGIGAVCGRWAQNPLPPAPSFGVLSLFSLSPSLSFLSLSLSLPPPLSPKGPLTNDQRQAQPWGPLSAGSRPRPEIGAGPFGS